jgi:TIR domain
MADIFISYSKSDHALALKLSAFLESEGWTVWWDKSLAAADLYRDEIMKQLAAARAVISIWTPNSVKSDWVRAEAGRAKAEAKLIPVKTADVAYADIPLPFGEMHTENIASTDLIRAAVVAQLAKPAVSGSQFWQITGLFKYQVLTWIGIIGSAITLFSNLSGVVNMADWARQFVVHWHEWNRLIWEWLFSWIRVTLPKEFAPIISFIAFVTILVIGINLSQRFKSSAAGTSHSGIVIRKKLKHWLIGILLYPVYGVAVLYISNVASIPLTFLTVCVLLIVFPLTYLLYVCQDRGWVLVSSLFFVVIGICLLVYPLVYQISACQASAYDAFMEGGYIYPTYVESMNHCENINTTFFSSISVLFQMLWMAVIIFSPLQQLTRRLGFVVLGVLTLVGLSEISKLDLHQYLQPPKASENSSPTHKAVA